MILPIYLYGSNCLRRKNEPVSRDFHELKQLVSDMYETMYHAEGCGIAAPQVGLALRLFVVDANDLADDYVEAKGFKKVFVNPEILEISGEPWLYREGCLSIPEFREDIVRKSIVKIKYFDEDFNEYTEIYGGIIARIIQHEYDHLESVLFPDLLSQLKKKMVKKKLDRIKTGKVRPHYASKFD